MPSVPRLIRPAAQPLVLGHTVVLASSNKIIIPVGWSPKRQSSLTTSSAPPPPCMRLVGSDGNGVEEASQSGRADLVVRLSRDMHWASTAGFSADDDIRIKSAASLPSQHIASNFGCLPRLELPPGLTGARRVSISRARQASVTVPSQWVLIPALSKLDSEQTVRRKTTTRRWLTGRLGPVVTRCFAYDIWMIRRQVATTWTTGYQW